MSKVLSALPSAVGAASAAQFQDMSVYQVGSCRQGGMLGDGSPESRRARRWRPPPVLVLVDDREDGIFARLTFYDSQFTACLGPTAFTSYVLRRAPVPVLHTDISVDNYPIQAVAF